MNGPRCHIFDRDLPQRIHAPGSQFTTWGLGVKEGTVKTPATHSTENIESPEQKRRTQPIFYNFPSHLVPFDFHADEPIEPSLMDPNKPGALDPQRGRV